MKTSDLKYKIVHDLDLAKKIIIQSFIDKKLDVDYILNYRDPFLNLKVRDIIFNLEGLLRLHLKTGVLSKKEISHAEENLKFLKRTEDFLGNLDLNLGLEDHKFNLISKKELLKKTNILFLDWTDNYDEIEKQFSKIDFTIDPKDLSKMFIKEIKRINNKNISLKSFVESKNTDHESLEAGFHEWRRSIRWISIYMQFYKDSFFLAPINSKFEIKRWSNLAGSDFVNFPNSKAKIRMDKTLFFELSNYIFVSGKTKDKLEIESLIKKRISSINYKFLSIQMYQSFNKSKLLIKLLKSIKYKK